jgi:hypothetical protein
MAKVEETDKCWWTAVGKVLDLLVPITSDEFKKKK